MIKVSVVIPVHNDAKFINDCMRSVLSQSFSELELIVVDDGSTDDSDHIINSIKDARIRSIRIAHAGAAVARNAGIKIAQGELIAFLDADDLWAKHKLMLQLANYQAGQLNFTHLREFIDVGSDVIHLNAAKPGISPITLLLSHANLLKIGVFKEQLQVAEFIEWQDRAKHHGIQFHVLKNILAFRRIHAANIGRTSKPNAHQYASSIKMILDRKRQNSK
jgi:glycosyltransferase involved in cell wall biosynthesis